MCSIFGYVATKSAPVELPVLRAIIAANIRRGPHAFGFAWVDARGRLRCFKSPGTLTSELAMLPIVREARMLIGHLRFATHGHPSDNANNHPHAADGGWLVHNGIVRNYESLCRRHRLTPSTECDSECLGLLIERAGDTGFLRRAAEAIDLTAGPLAMLALWPRPRRLIVARRGNPLHVGRSPRGLYFGTLAAGLPGDVRAMHDDTAAEFNATGQVVRRVTLESDAQVPTLYDAACYRGG
jgi:glucosamine 6-phosphate synthetase-like amidotransferase/phosphosugar isomerase protein